MDQSIKLQYEALKLSTKRIEEGKMPEQGTSKYNSGNPDKARKLLNNVAHNRRERECQNSNSKKTPKGSHGRTTLREGFLEIE